jgi:hypothetical protein
VATEAVLARLCYWKKRLGVVYCAESGAIRSLKIKVTRQRKVFIKALGRQTRCMVLAVSGGLLGEFTSVVGQLT